MKKILIIAPQLSHPCLDGADISMLKLFETLQKQYKDVYLVSKYGLSPKGNFDFNKKVVFDQRSKYLAGILTILRNSIYSREKFKNKKQIRSLIRKSGIKFDIVLYSYLGVYDLYKDLFTNARHFIWTHNYDLDWYAYYKRNFNEFLSRSVEFISYHTTIRILKNLRDKNVFLVNVSEQDSIKYSTYTDKVITVSIGLDKETYPRTFLVQEKPLIGFVGSLGNEMNYKALNHFSKNIWPDIKDVCDDFIVVGSNPSSRLLDLVDTNSWKYKFNLSNELFDKEVSKIDFLTMPFEYNNGFKLKMMLSLKFGIPILATEAIVLLNPSIGLKSNDTTKWRQFILLNYSKRMENEKKLKSLASSFSWKETLKPLIEKIKENL